jgi:hypothetical protein
MRLDNHYRFARNFSKVRPERNLRDCQQEQNEYWMHFHKTRVKRIRVTSGRKCICGHVNVQTQDPHANGAAVQAFEFARNRSQPESKPLL